MSGSDIHPEDLLDKMAAGTLSESEHEHLLAHLNDCEVCRFTLDVQDDLELEATGLEFGRVSAHRLLGLSGEGAALVAASARPRSPRRPLLIAIGVFAFASGAAALVSSGQLSWTGASDVEPSAKPPVVVQAPSRAAPIKHRVQPKPEPPAVDEPEARASAKQLAPKQRRALAPSASTDTTAEGMFASANEARRNGDVGRATRLYHQLQRSFPTSREAQLSLVTLGRLQLDSGNANAALSTFNRYLARGGRPLEAEALYGRALALGRLGLGTQEQKAWRALANKHPSSGYANKARERLRALATR